MSHCIVPNWNSRYQRLEDPHEGEERSHRSSHVMKQSPSYVVPMPSYEAGVAWGSREQFLHGGHVEILPQETKLTWSRAGDTLESVVHQAAFSNTGKHNPDYSTSMPSSSAGRSSAHMPSKLQIQQSEAVSLSAHEKRRGIMNLDASHMVVEQSNGIKMSPMVEFFGGKRVKNSTSVSLINKKVRSASGNGFQLEEMASCAGAGAGSGAGAGASATNMMTWTSFESAPSLKTAGNMDDGSACQECSENQDEEFGIKGESSRSQSSARRSRAAVVHNQSERRRRDRINEKMKALQKLVPNASKTDKASMLDEVIDYLKQLQAQVQMLSNARTMPQMVMPLGMQQQLQMSLLGRMGIGMGMGMLDVNNLARNVPQPFPPLLHGTTSPFVSPPIFTVPPVVPSLKPNMDGSALPNFGDTYGTFLAQQSMNMDFFNRMAALYCQQSRKPDTAARQNSTQRAE